MRRRSGLLWMPLLGLLGCSQTPTKDPGASSAPVASSQAEAPPRPDNEHVRRIGEQPLRITADPEFELELDHFVDLLWLMHADGARLYDGQILALGWTTVWFRAERGPEGGEFFVVSAPDYEDTEGTRRSDDLSETLRVLAQMRRWLRVTGVSAEPVNYDQHVLVARGALEAEQVFWLRVESPGGRLTGWRLAPTDIESGGDLEVDSMPVHEVWRRRPALLQTLMLPPGWMSYFDGDEVIAVVDPGDQLVWQREVDGEESP